MPKNDVATYVSHNWLLEIITLSTTQAEKYVAVTDLFPFPNQCARQAIRPLIDQSRQSALIPSSSQELFFLVPFLGSESTNREQLASNPNRHLSHPLLLIPFGTPSLKNTLLLASSFTHTYYKPRTNLLTGDTKRDAFSLSLLYACCDNKPFFVVLFKRSFICAAK